MNISCEFGYQTFIPGTDEIYACKVENQNIPDSKLLDLTGQHQSQNSNQDVTCVWIKNCNIHKIPKGLTKTFPNLKILRIENSNLKKVEKSDEYKNLEEFSSLKNNVEFLPGNLFKDFKNLQRISFFSNKLKIIEPNFLDGLEKLKFVDFRGNPNFNCFHSADEGSSGSTINEIKDELIYKFFASKSKKNKIFAKKFRNKVKRLKGNRQKLRTKNQNLEKSERQLRQFNEHLTKEIQKLRNSEEQLKHQVQNLRNSEDNLSKEVQKLQNYEINCKINLEIEKSKYQNELQKTFQMDIKTFLQDQNFKDFLIRIDDREFHVHKFILAARSPTLAEFFLKNPDVNFLNLDEISVEIFEKILLFIYTDELPCDHGTNYLHLYDAAARLEIAELKKFATSKIVDNTNQQNAVEMLMFGNKHKNYEIKQKAFDEVKKSYPEFPSIWMDKPTKVKDFIEVFGEYY